MPDSSASTPDPAAGRPSPGGRAERLVPRPLRVWHWTFPAQLALLVGGVLAALWGFAVWWQSRNPTLLPWSLGRPVWQSIALLILTVLIPLLVYLSLRLWLMPVLASHDDLHRAWSQGVAVLEERGISLSERPLFLALGSTGARLEQSILESSIREFQQFEPLLKQSGAPLEWYLSADIILIAARRVGCLGAVNALITPAGEFADDQEIDSQDPSRSRQEVRTSSARSASVQSPPPEVIRRQMDRMAILGELLRESRSPSCGLNGVLCLVPFPEVCHHTEQAEVQGVAIRDDLRTLGANLELEFPVICLLTELQREPGFLEVMRRTGLEKAGAGRLGRRYEFGALAGTRELQSFSRLLQHELEVRIYRLFGEQDVLKRPKNRELFELLCRMRSEIARPLSKLITSAFSEIPGERPEEIPFHFGGCYVAATGGAPDQRAFGPALIQRLIEIQDHVQWTRLGQLGHRWQRRLAVAAWVAVALLAALLFLQLYSRGGRRLRSPASLAVAVLPALSHGQPDPDQPTESKLFGILHR